MIIVLDAEQIRDLLASLEIVCRTCGEALGNECAHCPFCSAPNPDFDPQKFERRWSKPYEQMLKSCATSDHGGWTIDGMAETLTDEDFFGHPPIFCQICGDLIPFTVSLPAK